MYFCNTITKSLVGDQYLNFSIRVPAFIDGSAVLFYYRIYFASPNHQKLGAILLY
ncbi:hypothetical protein SAMN05216269_11912 [Flavobacterium xinjiangense]|jgi:hypothetical protein|uniref:Uncharacterized protein n=1 Tax=Flavobacterium xinjiangense TaxID=178356 RepID=A0A1M7PKW7_9FLAO|nr:hypothetical protein SAMN05216269_11912 [Flavobacterium xinjiangense]